MIKTDLNLLRVFDVVMEVRSVSRAADRLGLTQSAVSHALARLREQVGDPLFLRQRGGLAPTQRAHEIAPGIRDGLIRLRDAIASSDFDPASTTHVFTISAGGYFSLTLLPILLARLRRESPHAGLRIVEAAIDLRARFDDGSLDFAFGNFGRKPSSLSKTALFSDDMVWVGRAGSRRDDVDRRPKLTLTSPLFPVQVDHQAPRGAPERAIDRNPNSPFPLDRSIVSVHDLFSADLLIAGSDLVTLLPRQTVALAARRSAIEILAVADGPRLDLSMLWPSRLAADEAHRWLRGLIVAAAATLTAPVPSD